MKKKKAEKYCQCVVLSLSKWSLLQKHDPSEISVEMLNLLSFSKLQNLTSQLPIPQHEAVIKICFLAFLLLPSTRFLEISSHVLAG